MQRKICTGPRSSIHHMLIFIGLILWPHPVAGGAEKCNHCLSVLAKYSAMWKERGDWIWTATSKICYNVYWKSRVHYIHKAKESSGSLLWVNCNSSSCHLIRSHEISDQWLFSDLTGWELFSNNNLNCVGFISHQKNFWEQKDQYFLRRTMTCLKGRWRKFSPHKVFLFFSFECYIQKEIFLNFIWGRYS